MRTHCTTQRGLDAIASEVVLGCCRGVVSGDLGTRSGLLCPSRLRHVAIQIRRYLTSRASPGASRTGHQSRMFWAEIGDGRPGAVLALASMRSVGSDWASPVSRRCGKRRLLQLTPREFLSVDATPSPEVVDGVLGVGLCCCGEVFGVGARGAWSQAIGRHERGRRESHGGGG